MKNFFKVLLFIMLLCLCFTAFYETFRRKIDEGDTWKIFYEQEEDSIDVLAIGSSHVFGSVNPAVLYNDYGIACFDLCGAGLTLQGEYYYLKEAFKTQSPQIIIIGIEPIFPPGVEAAFMWSSGMKLSRNKYSFVSEVCSEQHIPILLEYPLIHTRYDGDLEERDFLPYRGDNYHKYYKGNRVFWGVSSEEPHPYTSESTECTEEVKKYLNRIIELANNHSAEVIFYSPPNLTDENNQKFINGVGEYVKKQGICYLNLNDYRSEIGINMETDMNDVNHVNYLGQQKTSEYIGDFLVNNYDIADRRDDERYESWRLWAEDYYNSYDAFLLAESNEGIMQYVDRLIDKDYMILINARGDNTHVGLQKNNVLDRIGVDSSNGDNVILIKDEDKFFSNLELNKDYDYGKHVISISEYGLMYDMTGIGFAEDSISFAVFDNKNKAIIEYRSYCYDSIEDSWEIDRKESWMQGVWNKR